MQDIFHSTLPIFLITLLGSLIKRKWLTSEEFWRGLEKLSYFLLFPTVLFNYISNADLSSSPLIRLVFALIISTSLVALGLVLFRKKIGGGNRPRFTSTFQGAIRYNSYLFFGLGAAFFGEEGLAIVSVIASYMIVFTNILSVMAFSAYAPASLEEDKKNITIMVSLKLIATNPLIIASILGFIFNHTGMELNLGVKNTIHSLSDSALAIGMLNVGAALQFTLGPVHMRQVFITSAIKLVALPIVTVIILSLMSITGPAREVGILYSCLPCASSAYILSKQLGGDAESMAAIITFSTVFSVLSLTILMYILA